MAGISNWDRKQHFADGESITLYEHKHGSSSQHHGDPIADVYSVIVRPNSCIIAVADGVNWGIKPRLAARCAVHGVIDHLNRSLCSLQKNSQHQPSTTQDIFHCILRSFDSGQRLIIERGGTTTTLCVGVVVELRDHHRGASSHHHRWGLCVVSVGDTLCYVWRDDAQMAYEVTFGVHAGKERNPRDCGGCLGCNLGDQPDLSNLLCTYVPLSDNDIVFVVSDGVSDNLDPVILREGMAEPSGSLSPTHHEAKLPHAAGSAEPKGGGAAGATLTASGTSNGSNVSLPLLSPDQRQALSLMKLTGVIKEKLTSSKYLDAQLINDAVISYVIEATEMKRGYLEQCWKELDKPDLTTAERRANDRMISQHMKNLPGKLDHATIATYKVGKLNMSSEGRVKSPTHSSYFMKKAEPQARKKSHSQVGSVFYGSAVEGSSCTVEGQSKEKKKGRKNKGNMLKSHSVDHYKTLSTEEEASKKKLTPVRAPLKKAATVAEDLNDVGVVWQEHGEESICAPLLHDDTLPNTTLPDNEKSLDKAPLSDATTLPDNSNLPDSSTTATDDPTAAANDTTSPDSAKE